MPIAQLAYIVLVLAGFTLFMGVLGFCWVRGGVDSPTPAKPVSKTERKAQRGAPRV